MNNLHRELAPISTAAWAGLEQEARRTFKRHVAGRRVVDVPEPGGLELSAMTTGHLDAVAPPADGVIAGIRDSSSNPALSLPGEVREYPNAISQAVTALRLAGVAGPYTLALSADAYTAVSETVDYGYPIYDHIARVLDGEIIWAPAIDGAFLLSTRGGDFELRIGQDLSIGYLSHDATSIQLYFQESLTFLVYTSEAAVPLTQPQPSAG